MSKQVAEAIVYLADAIKETFGDNPLVGRTGSDDAKRMAKIQSNYKVVKTSADLEQFKQEPPESEDPPEDELSPAKQKEAVRKALGDLQTATDVKTAKAVLNSFDATSIGKLNVEDYAEVIKACKEAAQDA